MAKRSLQASQDGITRAKRAFDRRGWTQEYLAAEVGLQTRQSVWKFFSGRPVERHIFIDLCFTLDLDWETIVDRTAFAPDGDDLVADAPAAVDGQEGGHDLSAARSHLIALANAQCQLLELPLDLHQPLTLAQLYTDAYVRPYQRLGRPENTPKALATAAVQPHSRVLILGQPGAGKTTLLQHLALEIGANRLPGQGQTYLPVFLRLRQLALVSTAELNVQAYLNQRWLAAGLCQPHIDQLWQQGQLWLLLDGWDELPAEHHRIVTQQLQALLDTYPGLRVLMSGRSGGPMPQLNGLITLELAEFAPQQIKTFVHKWFAANAPNQGKTFAQQCLQALNHPENDRLREMALTPILLHLMCLVFQNSGQFPGQRSKLYQQALDLLLGQWDQQRGIHRHQPLQQLSSTDLSGLLGEIAAHSFEQGRVMLETAELLGLIAKSLVRRGAQADGLERLWADSRAVLQVLIEHYGMLSERELGSYAFAHLSFQEYLAARYWALAALNKPQPEDWAELASHLPDPRWQEVIVLTVEMVPQAEALWQALWQESQRYIAVQPQLLPLLDWAQRQAERTGVDYSPAALRGFYLGLGLEQGLDLATALDARLAVDLPPSLALDQALIHLLHHSRQWLQSPTLQGGFDLLFGLDLTQRFALTDEFTAALERLQSQLLDALEDDCNVSTWCEHYGLGWFEALQQAIAGDRLWPIEGLKLAPSPSLQHYYRMQRLLVDCLRHNRTFAAATVQRFEQCLFVREVHYEHA
ncbi:NACHT domain-containing protein [Nodosilinea sp. E11]|uniref:NACHT domain-containing protein n=1 Tax=Nodosilinea sp. E11 TaxID=3037479 RepID=UPI00293510AE|nr:NACHT domain-containing protein [Nodosilinea sp. E11]WOD41509.1 NACHT domain-containing protein [Nodosilinea sp. E11]